MAARSARRVREQLVGDDRDGVSWQPMTGTREPDEARIRDLGGQRLTVADRKERVVLSVQDNSAAVGLTTTFGFSWETQTS